MEVADEIQISQAQVSRLEKNALKTILPVPYLRAGVSLCVMYMTKKSDRFLVLHF